ncbi:MAG: hypothetical protein LAT64_07560 [Phycisphaerales bacterium]|nr:hypothetical protein [Planctomycetota bacterium]MCH8508613.1 hypothetical protein [Phycisphaerales bacterium]
MQTNTGTGWRAHRRGNWLMGCGIALAVVVILAIGAIVFVAMNWRGWAASGMDTVLAQMITEMPLDDEQRIRTQAVADDFVQRFRDGSVSMQQMAQVIKEVAESPALPAGVAMGIGQSYFKESGLDEAERADGMVQVRRVAHGLADKTIDPSELRAILAPLRADPSDRNAIEFDMDGQRMRIKLPRTATDDDLRAFIEKSRETADGHQLPADAPAVDLATELDRAIRRGLGEPVPDRPEPRAIEAPAEP